jgi:hypothetical protein
MLSEKNQDLAMGLLFRATLFAGIFAILARVYPLKTFQSGFMVGLAINMVYYVSYYLYEKTYGPPVDGGSVKDKDFVPIAVIATTVWSVVLGLVARHYQITTSTHGAVAGGVMGSVLW